MSVGSKTDLIARSARVAKSVYAWALKAQGRRLPCRFESCPGHLAKKERALKTWDKVIKRKWRGRDVKAERVSHVVSASVRARPANAKWKVTVDETIRAAFDCSDRDVSEDAVWKRVVEW